MMLISDDGAAVELRVVGYEFPVPDPADDSWDQEWDANWLVVQGTVRSPLGQWSFLEPCLTTREAEELANLLEQLSTGSRVEPLEFTEPNLVVSATDADAATIILTITFAAEAAPPLLDFAARIRGVEVPLRVSPAAILEAAGGWRAELREYPVR